MISENMGFHWKNCLAWWANFRIYFCQ